ncbi:hypothetical protein LCGC14_0898380 [marine sediment metagenome]|uniref:Uncharacterized protein n=1 Tax=marine sediment metagenome TaxID=412755 RepID=A0A0F9LXU0_9ZZZZ
MSRRRRYCHDYRPDASDARRSHDHPSTISKIFRKRAKEAARRVADAENSKPQPENKDDM